MLLLTIAGVILALFMLLVAIRQLRVAQRTPKLICTFRRFRLIADDAQSIVDVSVHIRGKETKAAECVEYRFTNIGDAPIKPEDFVKQILLVPSPGIEILTVTMCQDSKPLRMGEAEITKDGVILPKALLNNDDHMVVRLLIENRLSNDTPFSIQHAIAGCREIDINPQAASKDRSFEWHISLAMLITWLVIGTFGRYFKNIPFSDYSKNTLWGVAGGLMFLGLSTIILFLLTAIIKTTRFISNKK